MTAPRVDAGWWVALAVLCFVLVAPLSVCEVPPLIDYPNHLARLFVLASLPADPALAKFYAPHWSVIPNLALDIAGPPLMHVLPVYTAGRVLIAISVLLPVLGTVAYGTALGNRWWPLGVGLVAWNNCLLYGFLNFSIALGLALLLAAAWLRWREAYPVRAIIIALAGGPVLFACHLMGLVMFAALIGGAELFCVFHASRPLTEAVRRGCILALIFAVPVVLYALSDLRQLGGDAVYLAPGEKLFQLAGVFTNYLESLDLITAAVAIDLPAMGLAMRRGRVPGPAGVAIIVLWLGFLAAPYAWKGTYHLDTRLAVMLDFMLFAGFVPGRWPGGVRLGTAAAVATLFAARMAVLTTAFAARQADIADIRTVLTPVQPGQAVYVASASEADPGWRVLSDGFRTDIHLGALALIERRAWWPFEFDNVSQQPLETLQPYRAMAERIGDLPDPARAASADVCGFDYLLLTGVLPTGADTAPELPPERFHLLCRSGFAALYAITRCRAPADRPGSPGP